MFLRIVIFNNIHLFPFFSFLIILFELIDFYTLEKKKDYLFYFLSSYFSFPSNTLLIYFRFTFRLNQTHSRFWYQVVLGTKFNVTIFSIHIFLYFFFGNIIIHVLISLNLIRYWKIRRYDKSALFNICWTTIKMKIDNAKYKSKK